MPLMRCPVCPFCIGHTWLRLLVLPALLMVAHRVECNTDWRAKCHIYEHCQDTWCTNQYDRLFDEQVDVDVEEREAQSQQVPQVNKDSSDTNTYFVTRTGITLSGDEHRIVKLVSNVDNPECISIPLLVDGMKTIAVIDTGANVTCMSTRLVKALKLMVITAGRTDRPIQLAHTNMTVKRIGLTVMVALETSRRAIIHPCEILDISEGYDLLIGMDTFYEFGFGISGLPGLDRDVGHMVPHPMEDEKSALAPLFTPAVEETPDYLALKRVLMNHIRPLLDENKATPKALFV
ncbi:hypothetical protein B0O80DRAFT_424048 [Mortierella sp. GBAus27b]|nr:hypothetical protein B0O80DRAFT_424048 [Mortierella sp. GBAus27b]